MSEFYVYIQTVGAEQMAEIDFGHVWSEVRSGLTIRRESLERAFAEPIYERGSALLDDVARDMTDRIRQRLEADGVLENPNQ